MHSRWSVHPEIEAGLDALPPMPFEAPEISEAEIPAVRQTLRRPRDIPSSMRHDVITVDRGDDLPQLDLHVYAPRTEADSARRGLLWIHGGGYIIAVAHETDFSGLPPTTIAVGTADLFCLESIELASRLISSGVPVDLRVYPGLPHGFDSLVPDSSPTRILQRDVFESLDRAAIFRHEP